MDRKNKANIMQRERQAVQLHMAGVKFNEIAEQLGYTNRGTAYNAVMRAIKRETVEDLKELRSTEVARCDELWMTFYPKARRGDPTALDKCIKIMERRSKYLGLDKIDDDAIDMSVLYSQLNTIIQVVKEVVPDTMWGEIQERIDDISAAERKDVIEVEPVKIIPKHASDEEYEPPDDFIDEEQISTTEE